MPTNITEVKRPKCIATRIGTQPVVIQLNGKHPQDAIKRLVTAALRTGWPTAPVWGGPAA